MKPILAAIAIGAWLYSGAAATAQNLVVNGDFSSGSLSGWTLAPTVPTTITYDATAGNPSAAALLARNDTSAAANGNYLYQIVPVVNGSQYKLSAQWKGDLLNGGTGRNWAEVYVNFTATDSFVPGTIRYKKATDGGPNQTPMPWDWENITTSPDAANPGPPDGIFTATGNYMIIAFNLGGRAQTSNNTQPGYYWLDNVSVSPWPPSSAPVFTRAIKAGSDIVLEGTNGPANGAYAMLRSTDLRMPVGSWQGLGMRSFDSIGNFSFTNPIVSDPASFYQLQVISSLPVFPPMITDQPDDLGVHIGQNATFNVTATGTTPLTYRWYYNTNTLLASGPSASLTFTNVQTANSGKISVTVSNLLGGAQSIYASLTVTNSTVPPGIATQPGNQNVVVGQTVNFSVTATGALPLRYQWYYNTNTALAGATNNTLTLLNAVANQAGKYSVTITNLYGSTNSIFATLTVVTNNNGVAIPDGYATQNGGTTGGGNATPIMVSTAAAFRSAVNGSTPRVVIVQGRIDLAGNASIGANKTIMGADTNSGLFNGTIQVQGTNYIFQNLTFGPTANDVLEISGGRNVFITKCEFYGSTDELCSIVRQADFVTVSWSKFYFPNSDSHSFAHLIGNGDGVIEDRDKLHVTLHHNWYAEGLEGRLPRVRFGHVHIYNNFYNAIDTGYCIGIGVECHIRLENSYFLNSRNPWADYGGTSNGEIGWAGLKFQGTSQPTFMPNAYSTIFTPPYPYTLDPVDNVQAIVTAGAGNVMP